MTKPITSFPVVANTTGKKKAINMKKAIMLSMVLFGLLTAYSQSKDSTATFMVYGVCEQCKQRIEKTLKIKGIRSAKWSVKTKMLDVTYDPSLISLDKIHSKLTDAGHDTDLKKAKDEVYNKLPDCCHYREIKDDTDDIETGKKDSLSVTGVVVAEDNKGNFIPLSGASIQWLGTNKGTVAGLHGYFSISMNASTTQLIVSHSGYRSDTLSITNPAELKIILGSGNTLKEVKIAGKEKLNYISNTDPFRVNFMTGKELLKAACCNLSESFETNPSVDVSYNDAVTGSKQIQLLGLAGIYTQLTVENLPGPRGIATPMGLNTIAGPWIESIQLIKGTGSVVNGFESIAGQINIELKKPENSERLYANIYENSMGKTDVNLNLSQKIGKKWSTGLLLHDDFLFTKTDENKDGFRDLPTGNLFSAINRWKYDNGKGVMGQAGFKILTDNRTGGQMDYSLSDKLTTNHYGLGIDTRRYEGWIKIGYVFPEKKYKSIGLQISSFSHEQNSYFGLRKYNAKQDNFYSNLIYQDNIGNDKNKFRTGLSFTYDKYDEWLNNDKYRRYEGVSGAFFEYTYTPNTKFTLVAGLRADYNNLYKDLKPWFYTPRLNLRYQPAKGTTLRLSAGRGQRTANIFAENMGVLVSSRTINIWPGYGTIGYGFEPEVAWNEGISLDEKFKLFKRDANFSLDFYRNDFVNQTIIDVEDPRQVNIYDLNGKSFSNSFQAELSFSPVKSLDIRLAYRLFDVRATYDNQLLQKPLTAKNRGFVNLAYGYKSWKFDYTVNYVGTKRIPSTSDNPVKYQLPGYSPAYFIMNAQVSKTVSKKHGVDLYLGGENLGNYYQSNAIIAADQPFGNYFDASLVWGPLSGRLIYGGLRFKIK
jgi:outer membrane receptor for ferrienterochelin and colicins